MSIFVSDTYVKTYGAGEPEVIIGEQYLSMKDFCEIVRYIMTNTDLKDGFNDPRWELRNELMRLDIVDGFNKGAKRLIIKED